MAAAELGDDTYFEDPTVQRLEERIAACLGMEASLLVMSGTMANLVALLTLCRPGDEIYADPSAHVLNSEAGGYSAIAGVAPMLLKGTRGHPLPDSLGHAIPGRDVYRPRPRLLWLENTNNRAGGTVMPIAQQRTLVAVAHERSLAIHLDGARLFNAAVSLGTEPRELAEGMDSVYVDLTKGLACPMGALLAGSKNYIDEARYRRRLVGGGMRQAGVIAACGLVALETLVDRLVEDHLLARWLAQRIAEIDGYRIDLDKVDTNIVNVNVSRIGDTGTVVAALREEGLLVTSRPPDMIRIVTHLQITQAMAEDALRVMEQVAQRHVT